MKKWTLLFLAGYGSVIVIVLAVMVVPEWKIYYDLSTNRTIEAIDSNNPRAQYYKLRLKSSKGLRIGFGPIPCSCQHYTCGCCAGMNIEYFSFNQRACMNFTYDPHEFSLTMDMFMNDDALFEQTLSGKNPPPACMPVPIPYLPSIDFCIRFYNIHTPGYNIFMCIDFETRIERAPILILHFDCMSMGQDGIQYHKPEDAEIVPEIEDSGIQNAEEPEVYDEVFEDGNATMSKANETLAANETVIFSTNANETVVFSIDANETMKKPLKSWFSFGSESTTKRVDEEYDEVFEDAETTTAKQNKEAENNATEPAEVIGSPRKPAS